MDRHQNHASLAEASSGFSSVGLTKSPLRRRGRWFHAALALLLAGLVSNSPAQVLSAKGTLPVLASVGTEIAIDSTLGGFDRPNQSRVFFHNGTWWLIALKQGVKEWRLWKLESGQWQDTGTILSDEKKDRPDCLIDRVNNKLYVFLSSVSLSRFLRLSCVDGVWSIDSGFPATIPQLFHDGENPVSFCRAKNGDFWAFRIDNFQIVGIRSTDDGLSWSSTFVVKSTLKDETGLTDCASFTSNGKDYVGVCYGENATDSSAFGFLLHEDGMAETDWIDESSQIVQFPKTTADDHVSMLAAGDGTVYFITKTDGGGITTVENGLYKRSPSGTWEEFAVNRDTAWTRPALALDESNDELYVFGTLLGDTKIGKYKMAPVGQEGLFDSAPKSVIFDNPVLGFVNVSTAAHPVNAFTGILVAVESDSTNDIWTNSLDLNQASPLPPLTIVGVTTGSNIADTASSYQIVMTLDAQGGLMAGSGMIAVTWPAGTTVPASISPADIVVNGLPALNCGVQADSSQRLVVFTVPIDLLGGTQVNLTFNQSAGILNPAVNGDYALTVQTSEQADPALSPTYTIGDTIPAAPSSLTAVDTSGSKVDLGWQDNAVNETGFRIERKENGGVFSQLATIGPDTSTYSDTTVQAATTYHYRVLAFNSAGNSAYSNEDSVTTQSGSPSVNLALNKPGSASDTSAFKPPANAFDGDENTIAKVKKLVGNEWLRVDLQNIFAIDRVVLKWIGDFYATSYHIQTSTDGSSWATVLDVSNGAGNDEDLAIPATNGRFVRILLLAGIRSNYRLKEFEVYGTGGSVSLPLPPSNLVATAAGTSSISLSWQDNASNEDGFMIERHGGSGVFAEIATVGVNVTTFNDVGLAANGTYTYRVQAFNTDGHSGFSNESSATTQSGGGGGINLALNQPSSASDTSDFKPPSNAFDGDENTIAKVKKLSGQDWLRVDLSSVHAIDRIVLKWIGDFFATSYNLQVSDDGLDWSTFLSITNGAGNDEEFAFAPVNGRFVRIVLLAGNRSNYRLKEFEVYGSAGPASPPAAPSQLSATATGISSISLDWQDNATDEDGFKVERHDGDGIFLEIATVAADSSSFNDSGLTESTTYTYRVRAFNGAGVSAYSDTASATTLTGNTDPVTLTFNPVADAHVESETPSDFFGTKKVLEVKNEDDDVRVGYLQFEVSGLQSAVTSAYLRLEVLGGSEDGGTAFLVSNNFEGTSTPWTETGLNWNNAPAVGGNPLGSVGEVEEDEWVEFDVTAAFTAGDGIYSFAIKNNSDDRAKYHSRESDSKPELVITMGQSSSATLHSSNSDSLSKSGANDGSSQEEAGDIAAAQAGVPQVVTLHQNYPNPFNPSTRLTYAIPTAMHVTLRVYNLTGQVVRTLVNGHRTEGSYQVSFDAGSLPSGLYLAVLEAGQVRQVRQLMLMK